MDGWMGVEGEREKERLRRLTPDELNNRIPKKKKKEGACVYAKSQLNSVTTFQALALERC